MGKYQKNIENARSVTIMQYLTTCHPGELVRKTDDEYCTKTHSSLVITPSKDLFHWFSQNIGGRSALDYMTNVERVDFVSAVRFLNELTPVPVSSQMAKTAVYAKQQKQREFELPKADRNCGAVTAYLMHRGISHKVLRHCVSSGILYQTTRGSYRNCVFVGKDEGGIPRSAFQRGCQGIFRGDIPGSQKKFGFLIPAENPDCEIVEMYEAPIDAMSGATLRQYKHDMPWRSVHYLALGGLNHQPIDYFLEQHPSVKTVVLCFDRDEPGRNFAEVTAKRLTERGYIVTELFTMQRYLQRHTLERHGLSNFDSWAAAFGETVTAIELAPEGTGYRSKTRFAKFFNLPELMAMFKECADIQTADMLKLPTPALVGGKPINIQLKPSEIQKQMVQELGERAELVRAGAVKPNEDNMLQITNDGRKLALDQRLIDPSLPDNQDSKVNVCVSRIFEIWEKTKEQRSAQLVFCDLSTPKAGTFNVYDDIKAKLMALGIPEEEIAYIHTANTDARKTELFGKVRSGAVRVLMGSTAKMGAGTNVQQRLIALHHLDVPWRPSDIEQREGRILRQGNENKEVYVFRYVTEGTFDAYSWQLIENKQRFIGQIMTSKSPARSCEDMDEAALSYAEVKALAAGNPLIKEKMDLDVQLTRLKTLKSAYDSQRYELENKIAVGYPAEIQKCEEKIRNAVIDAETVKEHTVADEDGKEVFSIQLMQEIYHEKEPAGKALLGLLGLAMDSEKPVAIGTYKGMELQIHHFVFANEFHARLVGAGAYTTPLGADVLGNLTRLSNLANGIEPGIEKEQQAKEQLEQQLAGAKEEVAKPFPQEKELAEKSKRQAALEALLKMKDNVHVTDTTPEQQHRSTERQRGQEER